MHIVYKFRIVFEEHDEVVRFIEIDSTSSFADFHKIIQQSIGFDASKQYDFYLSEDSWRVGEKVCSNEPDSKVPEKTILNKYINDPHQKFVYIFDPELNWVFFIELIKIQKAEPSKKYPLISRKEGEAPKQYKLKGKEPGATAKNEYDKLAEMLIASRMLENIEADKSNVKEEEEIEIEEELDDDIELDESALEISDDTISSTSETKPKFNFDLKFDEDDLKIDEDDLNFLEEDFTETDSKNDDDAIDEDDEFGSNSGDTGSYDDNYDDY